jgi:hypothetical protein
MTTLNSGLLLSVSPWCKYSLVSVGLVSNVVLFLLLASGLLPTQESNPEVLLNVSKDIQKATVRQRAQVHIVIYKPKSQIRFSHRTLRYVEKILSLKNRSHFQPEKLLSAKVFGC